MMSRLLQQLGCSGCYKLSFIIPIPAILSAVAGQFEVAFALALVGLGLQTILFKVIHNDSVALNDYLHELETQHDNHVERWLKGPLRQLQEPFVDMLRSKSRSLDSLQAIVHEMGYSSAELANNANQVATHSEDQSAATTSTAAATTEISQSIDEVAQRIEDTRTASESAKSICLEGHQALRSAQEQVNTVTALANETGSRIKSLEDNLSTVVSMSQIIREIAEQTNLLALNAAIEAARAGDHGRGFAVVADEVRGLAQRSHESANAITEHASGVTNNMKQVADHMDHVVSQSDQCLTSVSSAVDVLEQIVSTSDQVSDEIAGIASATEQQVIATREISSHIENVAVTAKENAVMAKQTADVAQHLRALVQS
ncbi:hypothetical protein GCM10011369_22250 [Neiella marina]|uniref:Methyl-accepting transducer domain-containing protein n=1 Tax=Neiella marina TaxID=508461 RepID=A0A8J2XPU2_9GAMM|nr:methyl-accepting chemotaxis protein [Neiella marina]GGA79815.1 hypothetical protein GCM10011369_22250 [Neiella marina]